MRGIRSPQINQQTEAFSTLLRTEMVLFPLLPQLLKSLTDTALSDSCKHALGLARSLVKRRARISQGSAREGKRMSQRNVQQVIGRLVTDEAFRHRFEESPGVALAEMIVNGLELTTIELLALASLDRRVVARFAEAIDPRIQKIAVEGGKS